MEKISRRAALLIGNSQYQDSTLAQLETPDADVEGLAQVLKDPHIGSFDQVDLLVDQPSTTVRKAISSFFARKGSEDLLLLYFSGHGVLDERGRLFLATMDTERDLLSGTAIPAAFITEEMDHSRSKRQVLILDCCHSGAFARGSKGALGASVGTSSVFEGNGFGRIVLTATDATQYAWEGDRVLGQAEHSIFTHYLIHGLKTGEADLQRNGRISVDELFDYVYSQVIHQTNKQTPGKWTYKEQGEMILARNPKPAPKPIGLEDDELKARLERLYTKGVSHFWLQEWEQASQYFQAIIDQDPNHQEAASKLKDVQRQLHAADLRSQAQAAMQAQNWSLARTHLKALLEELPDDAGALAQLATVSQRLELEGLYGEAERLAQERQWKAVVGILDRLKAVDPDYPDPRGVFEAARQHLEEEKRQKNLAGLYAQAITELQAENLRKSKHLLEQVLAIDPVYENAPRLLEEVNTRLSSQDIPVPQPVVPAPVPDEPEPEPGGILDRIGRRQLLAGGAGFLSLVFLFWLGRMFLSGGLIPDRGDQSRLQTPGITAQVMLPVATPSGAPTQITGAIQPDAVTPQAAVTDPIDTAPVEVPATTEAPTQWPSTTPALTSTPPPLGLNSTRVSPVDGMVQVFVPEGDFEMGSHQSGHPDEQPAHRVHLSGFWIDKTEVSVQMFARFVEATGHTTGYEKQGGGYIWTNPGWKKVEGTSWRNPTGEGMPPGDYPVVQVGWVDADAYCRWAGRRLPTEAEWEKAARGPEGFLFPWGNSTPHKDLANYNGFYGSLLPVSELPEGASPYGALHMAGNAYEWVADWHSFNYYAQSPERNPPGPETGTVKVMRGGSYQLGENALRLYDREAGDPHQGNSNVGFRCASLPEIDVDVSG